MLFNTRYSLPQMFFAPEGDTGMELGGLPESAAPDSLDEPEPDPDGPKSTTAEDILDSTDADWKTETSEAPKQEDTGAPAKPDAEGAPPPKETPAEAEIDARLKEAGFSSIDEVLEFKADRNAEFAKLQMLMEAAGGKGTGENMAEALEEMETAILHQRRNSQAQGAESQQDQITDPAPTMNLDGVFDKHEQDQGDVPGLEFTPQLRAFYSDLLAQLGNDMNGRFAKYETTQQLQQARGWYDQAKAANGDDPFPTFREVFNAMELHPEFVQRAQDRFEVFRDVDYNPAAKAAEKLLATKSPVGLTKGQQLKADAEALKAARLKRLGKPTRLPDGSKKRPSEEMADMATFMEGVPFNEI